MLLSGSMFGTDSLDIILFQYYAIMDIISLYRDHEWVLTNLKVVSLRNIVKHVVSDFLLSYISHIFSFSRTAELYTEFYEFTILL